MLVLTRRTGDSIVIGGQIVITVLEVRGDVVRIGVEAPRDIQVHRAEVYRAVQEANAASVGVRDDAAADLTALLDRKRKSATENAEAPEKNAP